MGRRLRPGRSCPWNSGDGVGTACGPATWRAAGSKLPNVPVTDLEYRAASNALYAATFGRGMYMLQLQ